MGKKKYERKLATLQDQLREVSLACRAQHRRAVIVFEGWDAAKKGIAPEEQLAWFRERLNDPLKQWQLTRPAEMRPAVGPRRPGP